MFCCKQHIVYTSEHITRTVSTTVYGIYIFWLQGIYTWESFASTWVHPRFLVGLFRFLWSVFVVFVFGLCVVYPMLPVFSGLSLRFSLPFIFYLNSFTCLMCPMLPVSLDSSFLISPSVFSNFH